MELDHNSRAKVAELADAPDLGSGGLIPVGVQVPPFAPIPSDYRYHRNASLPPVVGQRILPAFLI